MSDLWLDRLSEYVDGELSAHEAGELEVHLRVCGMCVRTLEELRAVRSRAASLDDRPPATDLWAGIAARIRAGRATEPGVLSLEGSSARRRLSFSVPQLLAAGLTLAALSGGGTWLAFRAGGGNGGPTVAAAPAAATAQVALVAIGGADYDRAVAELHGLLERHRGDLDTSTVRVLEESLASIDRAIADARSALAADPANGYLNMHLAASMRRKLDLLRRAAEIATARS